MSEYFSDKDDQSFDMPNDDSSSADANFQSQQGAPEGMPPTDESGFGTVAPEGASQQQDITYMAVMAVIVAGMIYILYTIFFTSSRPEAPKIEPVKVEASQKAAEPATPVVTAPQPEVASQPAPEPAEKTEPAVSNNQADNDQSDSAVTADNKKMIMANADKIDEMIEESQYMTNMVRKLNDAKGSIDNRFEDMESEVDRIVSTLKDLQAKLETVEKEMVRKKEPAKPKVVEITYHIQAVVEGRAWLEDNKGRNLTIKVGDIVPQYGVVTKIDAVNSLVFTSSGKTIRVSN